MNKVISPFMIFVFVLILFSSCTTDQITPMPTVPPKAYLSITGNAEPGRDASIMLEDGAGIIIPDSSMIEPVTVLVERNPEKAKSLPPLPEGFMPLSDFYNYTVTSGKLIGPVDLIMPFDTTLLPSEEGDLVALIPTADGWDAKPITVEGGIATYYAIDAGDPLIAWRFKDFKLRVDEKYSPARMTEEAGAPKRWQDCQDSLTIAMIPFEGNWSTEFHLYIGYDNLSGSNASVPLNIEVNYWDDNLQDNVSLEKTNENGFLDFRIVPNEHNSNFREGTNSIKVIADCGEGNTVEQSAHWIVSQYYVEPSSQTATPEPVSVTPQVNVSSPTPKPEKKIPAGAVQLPDFTGKPMKEAISWLKAKGFKYLWVDGSSPYELGMIYRQAPAAGTWYVPHRTSVVLYRTVETIIDPCAGLTAEECVNSGFHRYERVTTTQATQGWDSCVPPGGPGITQATLTFLDSSVLIDTFMGGVVLFQKTEANTYTAVTSDIPGSTEVWDLKLSFNLNGFIVERQITTTYNSSQGPVLWLCVYTYTYTLKNP